MEDTQRVAFIKIITSGERQGMRVCLMDPHSTCIKCCSPDIPLAHTYGVNAHKVNF